MQAEGVEYRRAKDGRYFLNVHLDLGLGLGKLVE
jgi:hypothetical protein